MKTGELCRFQKRLVRFLRPIVTDRYENMALIEDPSGRQFKVPRNRLIPLSPLEQLAVQAE